MVITEYEKAFLLSLVRDGILPPKQNQKKYIFLLGDNYLSLRQVSQILGRGVETVQNQVKANHFYFSRINDRPFIPEWSVEVEKAKVDCRNHVECFQITSLKNIGCVSSTREIKVFDEADILLALKQVKYNATVSKCALPLKEYIACSLDIAKNFRKVYAPPSSITREFLILPPWRGMASLDTKQKVGDELELSEQDLGRFEMYLILSNENYKNKTYEGVLEQGEFVKFKREFLVDPESTLHKHRSVFTHMF